MKTYHEKKIAQQQVLICNHIPNELCKEFNGQPRPCTKCRQLYVDFETGEILHDKILLALAESKI
jgi:cytidine deaminase